MSRPARERTRAATIPGAGAESRASTLHRRRRRPRPAPSGALSQTLSRAGRNREILRRRRAGQTLQSIGDASGLTRERVRQITEELDPGINLRRRAAEAARTHWTCPSCGKRVRWAAAMGCGACTPDRRRWTEARIVEAVLAFRVATGRWARTSDWSPARDEFVREQAARLRRYQDGDWPSTKTVITRFGRWRSAVAAAEARAWPAWQGGGERRG